MRILRRAVIVVALVALSAGSAWAEEMRPLCEQVHQPNPGAAAIAAGMNLVYVPVRFAVTVVGAQLGGLTGFLTAGDTDAARDVWGLADGEGFLTSRMVQGEESLHFGQLEFRRR